MRASWYFSMTGSYLDDLGLKKSTLNKILWKNCIFTGSELKRIFDSWRMIWRTGMKLLLQSLIIYIRMGSRRIFTVILERIFFSIAWRSFITASVLTVLVYLSWEIEVLSGSGYFFTYGDAGAERTLRLSWAMSFTSIRSLMED